jgi:hypothetical protein
MQSKLEMISPVIYFTMADLEVLFARIKMSFENRIMSYTITNYNKVFVFFA